MESGFDNGFGCQERGDACIVDGSVEHAPAALPAETCLCLVYQDESLKLSG